jgi:hypothetical protein
MHGEDVAPKTYDCSIRTADQMVRTNSLNQILSFLSKTLLGCSIFTADCLSNDWGQIFRTVDRDPDCWAMWPLPLLLQDQDSGCVDARHQGEAQQMTATRYPRQEV